MKTLQIGFPKSGNLWLYKIIHNVLINSGLPPESFIRQHPIYSLAETWELAYPEQASIDVIDIDYNACFFRISSIFRMPIRNLNQYLSRTDHVWTHSAHQGENTDHILGCFSHVIYIVRDPRDVLVSAAHYAMTNYMRTYYPHSYNTVEDYIENRLMDLVSDWKAHVDGYLENQGQHNIHLIRYEDLRTNFRETLAQLMAHLGLHYTEPLAEAVETAVSFNRMKARNPDHVRKGRSGYWTKHLSDEQQSRLLDIAQETMRRIEYI